MTNRIFNVSWTPKTTKAWKTEPTRATKIEIPNASDDIGVAAKAALQVFSSVNGSLAKVDVLSIQELDAEGNFIGEAIIPEEDSSIIPAGK